MNNPIGMQPEFRDQVVKVVQWYLNSIKGTENSPPRSRSNKERFFVVLKEELAPTSSFTDKLEDFSKAEAAHISSSSGGARTESEEDIIEVYNGSTEITYPEGTEGWYEYICGLPCFIPFSGQGASGCCEFINEHDITLVDGRNSRSVYPINITSSPGRLVTAGNAKLWLETGEYHARYSSNGSINADGREGWAVGYATLVAKLFATDSVTGDPVPAANITAITAKMYVVYKNLDFEGDEPKTTLHIELDATVDTSSEEEVTPPPI